MEISKKQKTVATVNNGVERLMNCFYSYSVLLQVEQGDLEYFQNMPKSVKLE